MRFLDRANGTPQPSGDTPSKGAGLNPARPWPGKTAVSAGLGLGAVFLLAGLLIMVPNFGAYGAIWTFAAAAVAGFYGCHLFEHQEWSVCEPGSLGRQTKAHAQLLGTRSRN